MPRDQPNEHPPGADKPANIPKSVIDIMNDKRLSRRMFDPPVQKAEKPSEIPIPSMIERKTMQWNCGVCHYDNWPVRSPEVERVPLGGVEGVVQGHRCKKCGADLESKEINETIDRETRGQLP